MKNSITEAIQSKSEEELISIGNLPLGQKLLALEIKPVTDQDLRTHFCADQLEKKLNAPIIYRERKERVMEKWVKHERKREYRRKLKEHLKNKPAFLNVSSWEKEKSELEYSSRTGDEYSRPHYSNIMSYDFDFGFGSNRKRVVIRYSKLNDYMEDVIPQYCLDQIEEAKKIGMDNFEVAYPVVEDVKQPDPVIISKVGDKMIWVTFYE